MDNEIGMSDIVERLRDQQYFHCNIGPEASDEIERLRQRLLEALAREKVRQDALSYSIAYIDPSRIPSGTRRLLREAEELPSDSTSLDNAIKQAKREALLEVAGTFDSGERVMTRDEIAYQLRRMARELK